MGWISEVFNFDNIGSKIKKLAKWSCWITIILIWIGAVISYIGLIRAGTPYIGWFLLTPIIAMAGTYLVWFGSWILYGFGESIEKAADNEENTRLILEKLTEDDSDNDYTVSEIATNNEFIENEDLIENDEPQEYVSSITEAERRQKIARITDLRKKNLISEELYQKAISNPRVLDKF